MKSIRLHISANAVRVCLEQAKWTISLADLTKLYKLTTLIIQYYRGTFTICHNGDATGLRRCLVELFELFLKVHQYTDIFEATIKWTRIYTFKIDDDELYSSLRLWTTKFFELAQFANWMNDLICATILEDGSDQFFKERRENFDLLDSVYLLIVFLKTVVGPLMTSIGAGSGDNYGEHFDLENNVAREKWNVFMKWCSRDRTFRPSCQFDRAMLEDIVDLL